MTPAETEALLTGQHVKLYPYARGHFPPETLFTIWSMMRAQGAIDKVFFGRPGTTPYQKRGDLVDFIKCFEPEPPVERWLLLVQSQKTPDDIAGICWFDDHVARLRVAGSVFYRRKYWGPPAHEATRIAIRWAFATLGVESVWAYSPWKTGQKHAEYAGMTRVATMPEYVLTGDQPTDLGIYRVIRAEAEA